MRQFLLVLVILLGMVSVGFGMLFRNLGQGVILEGSSAPTTDTVTQLQAENEVLRGRVARLELKLPRTREELAAVVGVRESEVDYLLDRSELLPSSDILCEAIQISGAQSVWKALRAESNLYHNFAKFKAENPVSDDRMTWHYACWAPFLERSIAAVCDQLYQLNMPSSVVESFRLKLREGI